MSQIIIDYLKIQNLKKLIYLYSFTVYWSSTLYFRFVNGIFFLIDGIIYVKCKGVYTQQKNQEEKQNDFMYFFNF